MSTLDEEFDPKPKTTKDYLMKLVGDVENLQKGQDELSNKVKGLEDDLIKREAKNKVVLWIVGIVAAFFGAIAAEMINKK